MSKLAERLLNINEKNEYKYTFDVPASTLVLRQYDKFFSFYINDSSKNSGNYKHKELTGKPFLQFLDKNVIPDIIKLTKKYDEDLQKLLKDNDLVLDNK